MNLDLWFSSRGLRALDYQKDIIKNKIPTSLETNLLPTVLAAAPSAGKTIMSIAFIDQYIDKNPTARVLVLTHGTLVLREQYYEVVKEMNPNFKYTHITSGEDFNRPMEQVVITLPHTIGKHKIGKFDLIVVDEAHHFYFDLSKKETGMVKRIIKNAGAKDELLLTGTPSKFIQREYPIIPVTVNQLLDQDMVADVIVELASSTYPFTTEDYNREHELKEDVDFDVNDTNLTLDTVLDKIVRRLRSKLKNSPERYAELNLIGDKSKSIKYVADLLTLSKMGKTMIACKSQNQAQQVKDYFETKGIRTALSISKTDIDSSEMTRFKNESDCLVLVVVARGILGFNFPMLENVIDMTASQNIDRIFQLMCRVLRKHPNKKEKFFYKVVPHTLAEYNEYVMTCVLCLTDEKYFLKFNGKNFLDLEIPVTRVKKQQKKSPKTNSKSDKKSVKRNIKSIGFIGQPSIRLFKDIIHRNHDELSSFAYLKIRDIRGLLIFDNKYLFEDVHEKALECKFRTEFKNKFPLEYGAASRNGWLEECCQHMEYDQRPNGYYTLELCKTDSIQYETRSEWKNNSPKFYNAACKNGWLEECRLHMTPTQKPKNYYTLELCMEEGLKYENRSTWKRNNPTSYKTAYRNGWLDICTTHMNKLLKRA